MSPRFDPIVYDFLTMVQYPISWLHDLNKRITVTALNARGIRVVGTRAATKVTDRQDRSDSQVG